MDLLIRNATTSDFGPATALEDLTTGLRWLHLDLTQHLAPSGIIANMVPGKFLEGWRYATPEELRQLFVHYTGSSDGKSQDKALAARMQTDLGGPLNSVYSGGYNPKTGWRRTSMSAVLDVPCDLNGPSDAYAIYGLIMNDNDSGARIDPSREGCGATDNPSYLVQETDRKRRANPPK